MFSWPSSPRSALAVLFHQDTKKCVIVQPYRFFLAKCFKHQLSFFPGAAREIHECFLKQTPFQFFDMSIFHPATPESPKIDIRDDRSEERRVGKECRTT